MKSTYSNVAHDSWKSTGLLLSGIWRGVRLWNWTARSWERVILPELRSPDDDVVLRALRYIVEKDPSNSQVARSVLFELLSRSRELGKEPSFIAEVLLAIAAIPPLGYADSERIAVEESLEVSDVHERAAACFAMRRLARYLDDATAKRLLILTADPNLAVRFGACYALASMDYDGNEQLLGVVELIHRTCLRVPSLSFLLKWELASSLRPESYSLAWAALHQSNHHERISWAIGSALSPTLPMNDVVIATKVLKSAGNYASNRHLPVSDIPLVQMGILDERKSFEFLPISCNQAAQTGAYFLGAVASRLHLVSHRATREAIIDELYANIKDGGQSFVWALSMFGFAAASKQKGLLAQAVSSDGSARLSCVEALGRIPTQNVPVQELLSLFESERDSLEFNAQCLIALIRLGAAKKIPWSAHNTLVENLLLKGQDPRPKLLAIRYLGMIETKDYHPERTDQSLSLLQEMSGGDNPWYIQREALRAIARIEDAIQANAAAIALIARLSI